jgi:hypothetical protein
MHSSCATVSGRDVRMELLGESASGARDLEHRCVTRHAQDHVWIR